MSSAPDSRLGFGENVGVNWEEPTRPQANIPHQCPDLAPCWDGDGSHLGRCKFKEKSPKRGGFIYVSVSEHCLPDVYI